MEERSLRITGADKTFFNKITNTLTRILIPTKIRIHGMLISIKRNNMIKRSRCIKWHHLYFKGITLILIKREVNLHSN